MVSLTITDPVHIANWGTFVTTPEVGDSSATVRVATTIENHTDEQVPTKVEIALLNPDG